MISFSVEHGGERELATLWKMELQYYGKITCNFLQKALAKNIIEDEWYQRFKSNLTYFYSEGYDAEFIQKKFQGMKVTVLGAGGGGSQFIMQLVGLGVKNIHIVDHDKVELSNINRQLFYKYNDIGKYKVEVAKQLIQDRDPNINVKITIKKLETVNDVESVINGSDWVFCAMDEPPYIAQRIVNRACYNQNIPSIYAFSQRQSGRMFEVFPNKSGCADCLLEKTAEDPSFVQFVESLKISDFSPNTPLIPPTLTLLTSWIIKRWVDIIVGKEPSEGNKLLRFDYHTFQITEVMTWDKSDTCPTCGSKLSTSESINKLWDIIHIK